MKRHLHSAFTLTQMLVAMVFYALIIAFIATFTVSSTRLSNVVQVDATMEKQTRHQVDQITQDLHDSSQILASYAASGGAQYTTDTTSTLVMQAPSYDANGNMLNTNDIIVYHLVGNAAPYTLNRAVFAANGSARKTSADSVIVSNVQQMAITYLVDQVYTGDGKAATFSLTGYPQDGTTKTVTMSGNQVSIGTGTNQVQFVSPASLTFGTIPVSGAPIDALYTVSPATYPSAVTSVQVDITTTVSGANVGYHQTQTVELTSQANLRNH